MRLLDVRGRSSDGLDGRCGEIDLEEENRRVKLGLD